MIEVFLDSAYAIALASPSDQLHDRAVALAEKLEANRSRLVTTQAVVLEIGNALSKRRHRAAAVQLISTLEADPTVEVIPLSAQLFAGAFELFRMRPDKEWGLIDCLSFLVMEARGIAAALTADEHFVQAGYQALLRDP